MSIGGARPERASTTSRLTTFLLGAVLGAVLLGGAGAVVWHNSGSSAVLGDTKPNTPLGDGDVGALLPGQLSLADLPEAVGMGGMPGNDYPYRNLAQDSKLDPWGEYVRECTSFAAWALHSRNHFDMPFYANAIDWGTMARQRGVVVNGKPAVGAVAWSNGKPYGHVAWVSAVSGSSVTIQEYNEYGNGAYDTRSVSASRFQYIHFRDLVSSTPVTSKATTKTAAAPASASHGSAAPIPAAGSSSGGGLQGGSSPQNAGSGATLQPAGSLPNVSSAPTSSSPSSSPSSSGGSLGTSVQTTPRAPAVVAPPPPPPPPPPAPATHREQASVHHAVPTFANPNNASGVGPSIPTGAWVQVSCKLYDPSIASATPDGYWYKIASSPWRDGYWAVANTFMNGDPDNGPYTHNTDFGVPNC